MPAHQSRTYSDHIHFPSFGDIKNEERNESTNPTEDGLLDIWNPILYRCVDLHTSPLTLQNQVLLSAAQENDEHVLELTRVLASFSLDSEVFSAGSHIVRKVLIF